MWPAGLRGGLLNRTGRRSGRRSAVSIAVGLAAGLATALATALAGPALAAKPQRIVSLNVCTDQLVMLLADRARIASVSYVAADPGSSAMAEAAAGLTLNHGLAEEVLGLDPDLVLAGAFGARPTVFLLRRLGYRVVELPLAATIADARANIRTVGEALGERERGEALIAEFDRRLAAVRAAASGPRPLAAIYSANGVTLGAGILASAALEAAGFRNLAARLGLSGAAPLPLERLLVARPDVLVIARARDDAPGLADEILGHPALRRAFADHPVVRVPDHLWTCGTPFVAQAIECLAAYRERPRRMDGRMDGRKGGRRGECRVE